MIKVLLPIFILFEGIFGIYSINPIVSYVGCFKDSRHQRILNGLGKPLTSSSMTIALCTNYCAEHSFRFAGLQFRSECYCGNNLPSKTKRKEKIDVSNCCSWTCSGQYNETCGGDLCSSVFAVNGTIRKNYMSATSASVSMLPTACRSNPCGYGGTCVANLLTPVNGSYQCQCVSNRMGINCEHLDPCRLSNICPYGDCLSFPENGSFACQCRSNTCSSPQAVCDSSKLTKLTCKCPPNRFGEQCELSCSCQHGGRCIIQKDNTTTLCQCDESRFYGDQCENISPCASQPCYMGGTCIRNGTRFVCNCPPNRIGSQCEKNDPCQSSPCIGNSTCYRINDYVYKCVCDQVHTGKNCQDIVPTISRYGLFHSACVRPSDCDISLGLICFPEHRCACMDGYTWTIDKEKPHITTDRCEPINTCLQSPCLNQGRCEQRNGTNDYICHCRQGFAGKNCQIQSRDRSNQCYAGLCLNGGSCYLNVNGQMECRCPSGYMGRFCDITIGPCYSNPCPHPDSVCLSVQEGFVCLCNDNQLLEPYCNRTKYCAGSICNGRGICYNTLDDNSYCRCLEPYTGSRCTLIDTCSTEQKCHPSATCIATETGSYCACPPDRTGPTCHEEYWLDPCLSSATTCFHHGTCTSSHAASLTSSPQPYKCACTEAYTGSRCEMELPCPTQRCLHNGTCQRNAQFGYFECLCMSDYLGSSCERAIRMTTPPSPCSISPCFNGGICSVTSFGGFICVCLPNYTGTRCEDIATTRMTTTTTTTTTTTITTTTMVIPTAGQITRANDVCQNNSCLNAGSCILTGVGGFICQCLNGFTGNRCEARVNDIARLQSPVFSLINLAWIIPIGLLLLVVITMLIGFICCRKSSRRRKEEPIYMFDQGPYPTTAITGHTKYREYSNPGFVLPSNMSRE